MAPHVNPAEVLPPQPNPEADRKTPENGAEKHKGPGEQETKLAAELTGDLAPQRTKADIIMSKLEHFGFGDLVSSLTHKNEATPPAPEPMPVVKAVETPAPSNNAAELGDNDFDAIKDFAKPTAEVPVPPPPTEQAKPVSTLDQDQGPLDHTNETNSFILEEERRRKLGIPWDQWQQYKQNEVAQAQQKIEDDKRAADAAAAQTARNEQVANMMDATRANIDAAGDARRAEAGIEPMTPADDEKRRQLGMSVEEYQRYNAQIKKEQQSRADTAAREEQQKQKAAAEQQRVQQSLENAHVDFQPRTTGDAETDALGAEIVSMQQKLQELRANGGTNANTIASSEANLQVQIDAAIKKWKKRENDAYWKKKNAEPMDNFRGFKLKDVGEGLKGQATSKVNTGELQQAADWAREAMKGKTEEEQKKILADFDPAVRRAVEIDNQHEEQRQQRAQREAQAKQDALNPDEARQRQRQETMAEWVKQHPEPTDSPLEHSIWMKKLAEQNAQLDAADLDAARKQEIKAKAEAAEPENIQAVRDGTATTPEQSLSTEAAMAAEIAELKAQLKEKEDQEDEAMKMITGNPELIDKLPEPLKSQVKEKKKFNKFAVFATLLSVTILGVAKSAGSVATGEMSRGMR